MSVFNPNHADNIELAKAILTLGTDNPYDEELRICRAIMRQKDQMIDKRDLETTFGIRGERASLFIVFIRDLVARKVITFSINTEKSTVLVRLSAEMNAFLSELSNK